MDIKKRIDVKEILQQKAPKIAKKIPGFLVNYLIRLIHQDEINDILERHQDIDGVEFMQALVDEFEVTLETNGMDHIPKDNRKYIFVSNHPLGGLDGVCLGALIGKYCDSKIYLLVNDLLLFIPNFQSIFIPVNKHGAQGKRAALKIEDAFQSDRQMITFPAGLCSRKRNGQIRDPEWKKSFIQKAVEYQRDVVPVYFEGRNSNFFYRLANFRVRLGIKMNFEMLYLPDEMFKQQKKLFRVYFGKPVPWQTFDHSKRPAEWAEWVKQKVYAMIKENNRMFV
ncbi:MAG: 1-acyl-sn-glycerol-3-phosphate acyltransferase [Tannerella sp.]|jgi:putative hemolysin|nr:1-acyl-sn-glycerol-3-phosphate acyltransferase [Tannerella sp.]